MRRLSTLLLVAGALVGLLGVFGVFAGAWANLPPAAVKAVAMSLPFVLGGALLAVGALLGRVAARRPPVAPRRPLAADVPHEGR